MQIKYLKSAFGRAALHVGAAVLSLAVLAYTGYHVWRRLTSDVTTATALPVTVESVIQADGYIFREEQLLYASSAAGGAVTSVLSDGEKVGVSGTVAQIYDKADPDVIARLLEIEEQLRLWEDSSSGNLSLKDISRLDEEAQQLIVSLRYAVAGGDYSGVPSSRRALITNINKREIIIGESLNVEDEMASLRAEAASLTRSLGTCREVVTSPVGGYYYASVDGYETLFTPAAADTLTPASFRLLIASRPTENAGLCVGKLVTSYTWQVCCAVDRETAERFTAGEVYPVGFPYNHDTRVNMTLDKIVSSESDAQAVMVFSSSKMPDNFEYTRIQPLEIVDTEYTGFRIPVSAVRVVDGQQGVYILDGSVVRFRRISVIATLEDRYIADVSPEGDGGKYGWLSRNDVIIMTGKSLYDGRILT